MTARPRQHLVRRARRRARSLEWADRLRGLAGTLLGGALIFAPWCWGCAWPAGIHALDLILLPATAGALGAMVLRRERRPALLFVAVALVLIQGWVMTLNAGSLFAETTGLFAPLDAPLPGWPGSIERDLSRETMARLTALLGALLTAASLGRDRAWRRRFLATMIATAVSIVLLGCAEHAGGARDIFWSRARHLDYFFATYRNVTNAGEYLNLAAPLALAAASIARAPGRRAGAVCALAVIVVGICVGGSKAAPMLAALLGVLFLFVQRRELIQGWAGAARGFVVIAAAVTALALMVWGAGISVTQDRWDRFLSPSGTATLADRLRIDELGLAASRQAGLLGAGPGTFPVLFACWQRQSPDVPAGRWLAAHNDYLQTDLEWGALGSAAWAVVLFGSLFNLARGLGRSCWRVEDRAWALGLLLALVGTALMALVDFPWQVASIGLDVAVLAGLGWSSFAWPRACVQNALNFPCAAKRRS